MFTACSPTDSAEEPDIEGILVTQGSNLNWELVESQLASIREIIEYEEILPRLQQLRRRHEAA